MTGRLTNFQNGLITGLLYRNYGFGNTVYIPDEEIHSLLELQTDSRLWQIVRTWKTYDITEKTTKEEFINSILVKELCTIDEEMKDIVDIQKYYVLNDRVFFSSLGYTYNENINFNIVKF